MFLIIINKSLGITLDLLKTNIEQNITKIFHSPPSGDLNFEKFANGVMKLLQTGGLTAEKNLEKEARRRCNIAQIDETEEKIC